VVASALQHLRARVVFIGGAIIGLLITDPGAPDARHTQDVDAIVQVTGFIGSMQAQEELRNLGFKHDISEDAHMLRFLLDELIVDILPQDGELYGMKTDWYGAATRTAENHLLEDGQTIRVINAPIFLCTKFHAYHDRGKADPHTSKDLSDILCVVDGRSELLNEISQTEPEAREYIKRCTKELLETHDLSELIVYLLEQDQHEREDIIIGRLQQIQNVDV